MPLKPGFRFLKRSGYLIYRLTTWVILAVGLCWALAVVVLRFIVWPNIDDYREPILSSVSQAVGQTVEIGRIEGDWYNFWPALRFFDVRVREAGGQQTLALARVDTVLSWRTLIAGNIVFRLIEFSGSNVEIRRDSLGTIWVAGKALESSEPETRSRPISWLFAQQQIVVKGAQITWIDEMRAAPVLVVGDVSLRIRNDGLRHRLIVTGKPPTELASTVTVTGDFFGKDIEDFSGRGRLFAEFEYVNLALVEQWLALPVNIDSGLGVMRLWVDIENRTIRRIATEGDLVNIAGRLGADLDTIALASLSGRVQWEMDTAAETISISNLTFEAVDGARLAPANILLRKPRALESRTELRISSLELGPLADLSRFLPVSAESRERIVKLRPAGIIDELEASWIGGQDGPHAVAIDGRFREFALAPVGNVPGFSGIDGSLSMSEAGGTVALKSRGAKLDYPQLFAEPFPFDYLDADARWQLEAGQIRLTIDSLSFTNEHAAGKVNGSYFFPGKGPGEVDIRAVLVRANARDVWRYFPHMLEETRNWLKQGLVSGTSDDAKLHFTGPLDKFPFKNRRDGIFDISARVHDAAVRIGQDWPLIEGVNGEFLFNGDRIDIKPNSGTITGADVSQTKVSILDIGEHQVRLSVDGKATGEVGQYLRFVANSPVARYTKRFTENMRGEGVADLALRLDLPFFEPDKITADGRLEMSGSVFKINARSPDLTDYAVRVEFDEKSIALRDGHGQMLGGGVRFQSIASAKATHAFYVAGQAEARDLGAFLDIGAPDRLEGRAEWSGSLNFDDGTSHLRIESTLVGIRSRLPMPLDKPESNALPISVDLWTNANRNDEFAVRLDKLGSARLKFKVGKLERGEIVFGGEAVLPRRSEITVRGTLTSLDYDGWRELVAQSRSPDASPISDTLDSLDLKIGSFRIGGRSFENLQITGTKIQANWKFSLAGPQIEGNMLVGSDAEGRERINARFKTLSLVRDEPSITVPVSREQLGATRRIPAALNVIVDALQFEGKALGRVELLAEPTNDGWQLERLAILNPDGRMDVKGEWHVAVRPHAEYTVRIEAMDNGKFLKRLGYAETVVGGTGLLAGPVSWLGGPFQPDLPTLNGKLRLEVLDGRFAQVDPGAAQLIGILSLQALPRRITLNFKDVFSTGFSFDRIQADVTVTEGVARTDDFRMEGVAAEVTMKGEVNLVAETQNLDVHVKPQLSGAAAVAGAAVVNPLVGVAALLVQKALGDPVEQAASRDYRVTGTWADPQVERIQIQPASSTTPAPGR